MLDTLHHVVTTPKSTGENREKQKRENTREQILEAARAALIAVGYENITTRRIAEAAHVNIATLHYYFGTKEALLTATIRYALAQAQARLRAAVETAPTAADALRAAFVTTWEMVQERPGILRFDLAVRGLRDGDARQEVNLLYAEFRNMTQAILERHAREGGTFAPGITPQNLAHYLVAATDGVLLQHALGDTDEARHSFFLIEQHALQLMGRTTEL